MGISASLSSANSSVECSKLSAANSFLFDQEEDDDDDEPKQQSARICNSNTNDSKIPSRRKSFLLFNEKALNHSKLFMQNYLERKIFIQFILQECWRGRLNRELKNKIINQIPPTFWNANKLNSSAKKISLDETCTDNYLHDVNNILEFFPPMQLQSLLIICCLSCYFELRCRIDFQTNHTQEEVVAQECIKYGLCIRPQSSLEGEEDDDDENDDEGDGEPSETTTEYEERCSEQEGHNPEVLLSIFANDTNEDDLEKLLSSGAWISHAMAAFIELKSTITIWDISPVESSQVNTKYTPSLIYSTKDVSPMISPQKRQLSPFEDSHATSIKTKVKQETTTLSQQQHFLYKEQFQHAIHQQHYYKTTLQLPSTPPAATANRAPSVFTTSTREIMLTSPVNNTAHSTNVGYDNLFLHSANIAMLPMIIPSKCSNNNNNPTTDDNSNANVKTVSYVIVLQHSITGSAYDRMMIRMTDLILFAMGLLISI